MRKIAILLMPILGATACAPLSQASLVYASSSTVGIKASAATPANPGAQLSIGYDQLDAAYVPVAFARPCHGSDNSTCTSETHPIGIVTGENNVDRSDQANDRALELAETSVRSTTAEETRLQGLIAGETNRRSQLQEQLTSRRSALGALDAADTAGRQQATADVQRLEQDIARASAALGDLQAQLTTAQNNVRQAVEHRQGLLAATARNNTDFKRDAFSVFGSFDAGTTVGAGVPAQGAGANAGLDLGRVFSTGVASQNLTQGIRESGMASALANCLAAAERAALASPQPSREETREELSLACARSQARTGDR